MAKICKIDDEYYVEYRAQGLTFRKKAGKSKEEAIKLLEEINANSGPQEYHHKEYPDKNLNELFSEFLQFSKDDLYQKTVQCFKDFIREQYPQICKICEITPRVVVDFQVYLKNKSMKGSESLNAELIWKLLNDIFEHARKLEYINDNPMVHVRW